jgi:hypothetical protein
VVAAIGAVRAGGVAIGAVRAAGALVAGGVVAVWAKPMPAPAITSAELNAIIFSFMSVLIK